MPYLAFNLNNGNEFIFDLVEERVSLGRNSRNEIVIENTFISSFHAELLRQKDGGYEIVDLKSANGTFVNDARIERAMLHTSDHVRFGQLVARYRDEKLPGPERVEKGGAIPATEKMRDADEREGKDVITDAVQTAKKAPPSTKTKATPTLKSDGEAADVAPKKPSTKTAAVSVKPSTK